MDFIEKANQTSVSSDLLIEANHAISEMNAADRDDLTARTIEVIKLLESKKLSQKKKEDLLVAINFRLTALARLEIEKHKELGGWSIPGKESGMVFAHEDLFKTAALEALVNVGEKAVFDPESFFTRLLALSKTRGRA